MLEKRGTNLPKMQDIAYNIMKNNSPFANSNKGLGQYGLGNIDLYNRPQVKNPDGSISTVRSMSFNDGSKEVLIPTVSDDGRIMTDNQAIDNYYKTGKYLGKFNTVEEATKYAEQLHNEQDSYYNRDRANPIKNNFPFTNWNKEPLRQYGEYRQPYQSELDYFKNNKHVGGMATEDNKIILNPYSNLNDREKQQVGLNEGVRLFLRENPNYVGNFGLTKQQQANLGNYSKDMNDIRSTILARILTNDPSVGEPTLRQRFNAYRIKNAINEK